MLSLTNRIAVITGGGSGIGQAIAELFAERGAYVQIIDCDQSHSKSTVERVVKRGGRAKYYCCDVSSQVSVSETFGQIERNGRVEILVNNAGVSHVGNVEDTDEEDIDRVFRINIKGVYNCLRACVGHMKTNGGGGIVNMASVVASAGVADRFAYSMSKGAVVSMTYSIAKDYLVHKIRCNCISPARVHTTFVDNYLEQYYPGKESEKFQELAGTQPIGRMAEPGEIASLALFLCSDEAAFITGTNYPVDGGFLRFNN